MSNPVVLSQGAHNAPQSQSSPTTTIDRDHHEFSLRSLSEPNIPSAQSMNAESNSQDSHQRSGIDPEWVDVADFLQSQARRRTRERIAISLVLTLLAATAVVGWGGMIQIDWASYAEERSNPWLATQYSAFGESNLSKGSIESRLPRVSEGTTQFSEVKQNRIPLATSNASLDSVSPPESPSDAIAPASEMSAPTTSSRFSIRVEDPGAEEEVLSEAFELLGEFDDTESDRSEDLPVLAPNLVRKKAEQLPPIEAAEAVPDMASRVEPERFLVRDQRGRAVVSQVVSRGPQGPLVLLPDGTMGWPEELVPTDEPFRPWSVDQMINAIRAEAELSDFEAIRDVPFVVLSNGSSEFARVAASLLSQFYEDLTDFLSDVGFEIYQPRFPLIVVIFRNESEFRLYRAVDSDVRAYYEVASNRIILFESSAQDARTPDIASIRRPQAIVHEGVHQILQNIGVQPRFAAWPPWLVEGLAEYFAPASVVVEFDEDSSGRVRVVSGDFGRQNFGAINPFHMATLIDLQDPMTLLAHFQTPGSDLKAPRWNGQDLRIDWIARLVTRTELDPTDYALCWALTHFLAHHEPDAFRRYIALISQRERLEHRITPRQHLHEFRQAFGGNFERISVRINQHLALLDQNHQAVPYYAVRFEQLTSAGFVRRGTLVTRSPAMIDQWLQTLSLNDVVQLTWWAEPYHSRNQARFASERWIRRFLP